MSEGSTWSTWLDLIHPTKKTQKEMLLDYKYSLDATCRSIERQKTKLRNQKYEETKRLEGLIQNGESAIHSATLVVQYGRQIDGFSAAFVKLKGLEQKCQNVQISTQLADAMCQFTNISTKMNASLDLDTLTSAMAVFQETDSEMTKKSDILNEMFKGISTPNKQTEGESTDTDVLNLIKRISEQNGVTMEPLNIPKTVLKSSPMDQVTVQKTPAGMVNEDPVQTSQTGGVLQERLNRLENLLKDEPVQSVQEGGTQINGKSGTLEERLNQLKSHK